MEQAASLIRAYNWRLSMESLHTFELFLDILLMRESQMSP